ncbi:hypothetical protein E4Q23_17110 [Candidatus Accumulibacter phosphatis]|uniref:Uncharacterized protein n=1 Tax=Candidatus Accumulibacter phosphatis TaxID=327160 RepID=A0ABX1U2I6_9PROT|nr:hypothetical protein [Candidatus Accumulibacter phosphatis]
MPRFAFWPRPISPRSSGAKKPTPTATRRAHDDAVNAALLKQAEQAAAAGVEIDVRRFAVAVLGCHYRGIGGQRPGLGEGSAGDRRDLPIGSARHAANPRKTGECWPGDSPTKSPTLQVGLNV